MTCCTQATGKSADIPDARFVMNARKADGSENSCTQASFSSESGLTVRQGSEGKLVMEEASVEDTEFFDLVPITGFDTATASPTDL